MIKRLRDLGLQFWWFR